MKLEVPPRGKQIFPPALTNMRGVTKRTALINQRLRAQIARFIVESAGSAVRSAHWHVTRPTITVVIAHASGKMQPTGAAGGGRPLGPDYFLLDCRSLSQGSGTKKGLILQS